jgi:hypothetical protein
MNKSFQTDFELYKTDINTAKLEIKELEMLLAHAKDQYKTIFQEEYDDGSWYDYLKNAFKWINPLYYLSSNLSYNIEYYTQNNETNYKEGYDMYSSIYDVVETDLDVTDDEVIEDDEVTENNEN